MGGDIDEPPSADAVEKPEDEVEEQQNPADTHNEQVSTRETAHSPTETRDTQEAPQPSIAELTAIPEP